MSLVKETKRCPYCQEAISVTAIRCKHCHADLSGPAKSSINRSARYNTFRFGFVAGLLFSVMIAILGYLHCNGH
ncbi:MAG: hypothetical protein RBT76_11130 [candidate division Zixibacteria bacterium]|jgi:predicted amidophosphoribosyltransferase|nr:hypothetical protein [candidate division Zixibacteria bacterium]